METADWSVVEDVGQGGVCCSIFLVLRVGLVWCGGMVDGGLDWGMMEWDGPWWIGIV